MERPKIAIWTEDGWALGLIYRSLQKALSYKYQIDIYDWKNPIHNYELWQKEKWKEYDIITGNSAINWMAESTGFISNTPKELLNKMVVSIWAKPNPDDPHFNVKLKYLDGPLFTSPTDEISTELKRIYNIDSHRVIAGKLVDEFKPVKKVKRINVLGMNGHPSIGEGWCKIKRPEMLNEIASLTATNVHYIFDSKESGSNLYKDIDMYVCTSLHEAGPGGIIECALAKIPVISTSVGHAKELKSIKTFATVNEAVDIINHLNESSENIESYINSMYEEAVEKFSMRGNVEKYWVPVFEKRLEINR